VKHGLALPTFGQRIYITYRSSGYLGAIPLVEPRIFYRR
jgi:hypothetical protein